MKQNKLIILFFILGLGLFWGGLAFAQDLQVNFETDPLFKKANFLPEETVSRWAVVSNNSGESKTIGLRVINQNPCSGSCLSEAINLSVKKEGEPAPLYSGSLEYFFGAGEVALSDLNNGESTKYYFLAEFDSSSGNNYQDKKAKFDVRIGFLGEDSVSENVTYSSSSGAGGGRRKLMIFNEKILENTAEVITITWETNLKSTSKVIYSPEGSPHSLDSNDPPNYGYVFSTEEDLSKVKSHSVKIPGLLPGNTYYYRCVSRGSLAISKELVLRIPEEAVVSGETGVFEFTPSGGGGDTEEGGQDKESEGQDEEKPIISEGEPGEQGRLNRLLAAMGGVLKTENMCWLAIILIIIFITLFFVSRKERREGAKKRWPWFLPPIALLLLIVYCLYCPYCLFLIIGLIALTILLCLFFLKKRPKD